MSHLAPGLASPAFAARLARDTELIDQLLPPELRSLHDTVVGRAVAVGAHGLILSGSTARGYRTPTSDLDYHLIGSPIVTTDLSPALDLHVLSPRELEQHVLDGDDFIQWSLRFGCVVLDDGHIRDAIGLMRARRPWPDSDRKRRHALKSLRFAARVVVSGDHDAAVRQVKAALSLAARSVLLEHGEFPLSRAELPSQLAGRGEQAAARALELCIHGDPGFAELEGAVRAGLRLVRAGELTPTEG